MKKKRLILMLAALALIVSGALMVHPYPRQMVFGPKYNGVPLCVWQEEFRRDLDAAAGHSFFQKMREWFGLKDSPPDYDSLSTEDRTRILASLLDDADSWIRQFALGYFAEFRELKKYKKVVLPSLLAHLHDEDSRCRLAAARAVWRLTKQSNLVVPILRRELKNSDASLRIIAVSQLHLLGKDSLSAWDDLVNIAVMEQAIQVQPRAIWALQIGGEKAVPVLLSLLNFKDDGIGLRSTCAIRTLGAIGPVAGEAVPYLLPRAFDSDNCVVTLGLLKAQEIVEPAMMMLKEKEIHKDKKVSLISTLGNLGLKAKRAIPLLLEFLEDEDNGTRAAAVVSLARIESNSQRVREFVTRSNLATIAKHFNSLGPLAEAAVPLLIDWLQNGEDDPKVSAFFELDTNNPACIEFAPVNLRDKPRIIIALGEIHTGASTAVPALLPYLKEHPLETINALARFGPEAKAAIPALIPLLDDDDDEVSDAAAEALTAIDPERHPKK